MVFVRESSVCVCVRERERERERESMACVCMHGCVSSDFVLNRTLMV